MPQCSQWWPNTRIGSLRNPDFLSPWSVLLLELEKSQGQFVPFVNFSLDRKAENFHDYYTHRSHAWSKSMERCRAHSQMGKCSQRDVISGLLSIGRNRRLWLQPFQWEHGGSSAPTKGWPRGEDCGPLGDPESSNVTCHQSVSWNTLLVVQPHPSVTWFLLLGVPCIVAKCL